MNGYLIVIFGTHTVRRALGDEQVTLGRAPECTVVIPSDGVASTHAVVHADRGAPVIEDLGGGLLVNGQPVSRHTLQSNDEIALGSARLRYQPEGAEPVVRLAKVATDVSGLSLSGRGGADSASSDDPSLRQRLALLTQMASTIGADLDHRQVLDKLLSITFEALQPERAVLALVEGDGQLRFEAARQAAGGDDPWRELQISSTILRALSASALSQSVVAD